MTTTRADAAPTVLRTRHGDLPLPCFLPDATRATVRAVDSRDLRAIGIEGVVVNAFHLMRAPGTRLVKSAGGIHRFMDWGHPVVSDSGGFQVYSLIRQDPTAGTIRPNEVIFKEASTGEKVILSPEKVILSQLQLGSDILYCLDDCTDAEVDAAEQARAVERTIRWAAKGRATFDAQVRSTKKRAARRDAASDGTTTRDGTRPYLFGVVQGGGSEALRRECAQALVAIGFDGFGYGGWPLTPDGSLRADMLGAVAEALPPGTPLHALGVGRPDHVVRAHALGYTIFDCTLPTRDARRGRLYAWRDGFPARRPRPGDDFYEAHYLLDQVHANDFRPVDETCDCPACARHSRAYLRHLFKVGETVAWRLATLHNLRFYTRLMESLRTREAGRSAPESLGLLHRPH